MSTVKFDTSSLNTPTVKTGGGNGVWIFLGLLAAGAIAWFGFIKPARDKKEAEVKAGQPTQ